MPRCVNRVPQSKPVNYRIQQALSGRKRLERSAEHYRHVVSATLPVCQTNELLGGPLQILTVPVQCVVDLNVLHGYPELRHQEARYARLAAALRGLGAISQTVI